MKKEMLELCITPIQIKSIPDDQFQDFMVSEVELTLDKIKDTGYITRQKNYKLYYEKYLPIDAKRNVVISHGFTENIKKYREMIYYFIQMQCNVFIIDHQGHGQSFRLVEDYSITHIERFDDYVEDLKLFVDTIVKPNSNDLPMVLFAHSMGGMIAASYLMKYTRDFDKGIFSSPMLEMNTNGIPKWIAKLVTNVKIATGKSSERLFNHAPFDPKEQFELSCATSYERYQYYFKTCLTNESYQNSSASYAWLKHSLNATNTINNKSLLANIKIPILVFQAETDIFVKPRGQEKFVQGIADGTLVKVPKSKHEIYMTTSDVLTPYLNRIYIHLTQ